MSVHDGGAADAERAGVAITAGAGRKKPRGRRLTIPTVPDSVTALVERLNALPSSLESWWSGALFRDDHRSAERWEGCFIVGVDVDYHNVAEDGTATHTVPSPEALAALKQVQDQLPGNAFHLTPRGVRFVFVLDQACTDPELADRVRRGAAAVVASSLAALGLAAVVDGSGAKRAGYLVDLACLDAARMFFSPCALVDGRQRSATVELLSATPWPVELLAAQAPVEPPSDTAPATTSPAQPNGLPATPNTTAAVGRESPPPPNPVKQAAGRWNREHPGDWPANGAECPACGHQNCFGRLAEKSTRWACFAASHAQDSGHCGRPGKGMWHGDALDLEAHRRGCKRHEVLVQDGYLDGADCPLPPHEQTTAGTTAKAPAATTEAPGLKLLTLSDLRSRMPPPWLIAGILPATSLALLYAEPASFKTFVAIGMAVAIATGRPFLDRATRAGAVVYVAAEGASGLLRRVDAALSGQHQGADPPISFLDRSLLLPGDASKLLRAMEDAHVRPVLVIIDTLARCLDGDENSASDVGELIRGCEAIQKATGAAVLLVHHAGRDPRHERGSTALAGAVDTSIRLKRIGTSPDAILSCEKQKDAEEFAPIILTLKPVELGHDDQGKPIASLQIVQWGLNDPTPEPDDEAAIVQRIVQFLQMEKSGEPVPAKELEQVTGRKKGQTLALLRKAAAGGYVKQVGNGRATMWQATGKPFP